MFYKNTDKLVECLLSTCGPNDSFLIGTWGNQAFYKIESYLLDGNVQVKSVDGDTRVTISVDKIVWRQKKLVEILNVDNTECDQAIFGTQEPPEPKKKLPSKKNSNKLIDILDEEVDDVIMTSFY